MADKAHYVGDYRSPIVSLNNAHGATGAVVICRPRPCAVQNAAGEWIDGTRVRGARVHALTASGTNAAARLINLLRAQLATKAGGLSIASATGLARNDAGGDFTADGWQPGQRCILLDTADSAEDGGLFANLANRKPVTITGVAPQALTFAAGTFTTGLAALPATAGLYRVGGLIGAAQITTQAGNVASAVPVNLLTPTAMPWLAPRPDTAALLGRHSVFLAAMAGTALLAGETIDFLSELADY